MENNKLALVEGKYYRVYPIKRVIGWNPIIVERLPITKGLAIEEKCENNNYFVIALVKPSKDGPKFTDVDFRSIDTLNPTNIEKLDEYLNCVDFAKHVLIDLEEAKEGSYEY